ncbi:hypothetical protein KCA24_35645, partial [Escherichia coli]|nr:hypothetical protein [Escherichia coli]
MQKQAPGMLLVTHDMGGFAPSRGTGGVTLQRQSFLPGVGNTRILPPTHKDNPPRFSPPPPPPTRHRVPP